VLAFVLALVVRAMMSGLPSYLCLTRVSNFFVYKLEINLSTRSSRSRRHHHTSSVRKLYVLVIDVSSHGLQGAQLLFVELGRNRASAINYGLQFLET
jgi:hypothetical protein